MEEKITLIKRTEDIINYCFGYSQSVGQIMDEWERNKKFFYTKFDNKLMVKTEEFAVDVENHQEIRRGYSEFLTEIRNIIKDPFRLEALEKFFIYAVGTAGFKSNSVSLDWDSSTIENKEAGQILKKPIIKVNQGAKFSKALKNFFFLTKNANRKEEQEKLTKLQNLYSTYRQNFASKKSGRLYLSIHPLDYLSISDNHHNWTSCHNLLDGEYRVGNLNYLADGATMVAYYSSDEDWNEPLNILPYGEWNSKRWRVLVHMEESEGKVNIVYNKQYPYHSNDLIQRLDKLVASLFTSSEPSQFMSYDDDRLEDFRYKLYKEEGRSHAYVDIDYGASCYVRLSDNWLENPESIETISIGEEVKCLDCGLNWASNEQSGLCESCQDESYCDECGGYFYIEDLMYIESDDIHVCDSCYDAFYAECQRCNKMCGYDNMQFIEFLDQYVCKECEDDIRSTETSLVFSLNDFSRQITEKIGDLNTMVNLYKEIQKEEQEVIELLKKETPQVWLVTPYKQIDYQKRKAFTFDELINIERTQYVFMSGIKFLLSNVRNTPFERLEYLSSELPDSILNIVIMGSSNQTDLDKYLTELNISLEALGIEDEVKVDYSRVRVI